MKATLSLATLSLGLTFTTHSLALVGNDCIVRYTDLADEAFFSPSALSSEGVTVDVWGVSPGTMCAAYDGVSRDFGIASGLGFSTSLTQSVIVRALDTWNEQGGGRIRMYFRGFAAKCGSSPTDLPALVSGSQAALMIGGWSSPSYCLGSRVAFANPVVGGTPVKYTHGNIAFFKYITNGSGGCVAHTWNAAPKFLGQGGGYSAYNTLVHELGHAVFNIGDIGEPTSLDYELGNCNLTNPQQSSVMSYVSNLPPSLTPWDQEVVQLRYEKRSLHAKVTKSRQQTGSYAWYYPSTVNGSSSVNPPLFRPGSVTSRRVTPRAASWVASTNPIAVQPGGTGQLYYSRYQQAPSYGAFVGASGYSNADAVLGRPVATAFGWNPFGSYVLMAYMNPATPNLQRYYDARGTLCFRYSTDGGLLFSSEICPTIPVSSFPFTYTPQSRDGGVTATFDEVNNRFLVAFNDLTFGIRVLTVQTNGVVTAMTTLSSYPTPHTPSIACAASSSWTSECLITYQTANQSSQLGWLRTHLDTSIQRLVVDAAMTTPVEVYDTPSVAYNKYDNMFYVGYESFSAAIYSYKKPAFSSTGFSGNGDIVNDPTHFVSTPAMSTRDGNTKPFSWGVRYW